MFRTHKLLLDKEVETTSASGYGSENTETAKDTSTSEASGSGANTTANDQTKTEGDSGKETATSESKQAATSTEQVKDVTGYETDETKKEGSEGEASKDAQAADVKEDKPLELDLKGLAEENVKDLREFGTTHKFNKEQTQALVDKRKEILDANAKSEADHKELVKKTYAAWEKELKEDPVFGKENYATNIHNINKLLTDFMPDTTKELTESGRRISSIQMKEFAKIASKLYGEGELNEGSGTKQGESRQPWDAYKHE